MTEQDRKSSHSGESSKENVQSTVAVEEEGVDGEMDDIDACNDEQNRYIGDSPSTRRDGKESKDSRKHTTTSDRRRHHRHHHNSSHRDRRRRSGGHNDIDGGQYLSDEDYTISGRSKRQLENVNEADASDITSAARFSHRKQDKSHGNHMPGHPNQQRSRHNFEAVSDSGVLLESHEDPLGRTRHVSAPKRFTKDKKVQPQQPVASLSGEGEAEDGEILEEGELSDDEVVEIKDEESGTKDNFEVLPSKLSSKEVNKGEKHNRKKSNHKDRRKREADNKIKRKKYIDVDKLEDESIPTPAWGSGYQGPKPKTSPFHNKQQQYGRGSKGYRSPPGLYDSPYSEESDEEAMSKVLLTEGYIDASVAADEKEGIFNPKVNLGKKKKLALERNDRKRRRNMEKSTEGPPRKKPLVDMAMSDRPVCKFYMEGKCAKGSGCQFNHDVEKPRKMEVCKYHLTVKGCIKQSCLYMHEFPCKYYHTGAKCYSGDRCKFSHDPLTEDTRRALEMRVAAEDIIDMEDPDYDYDYRPRESHSRPSLLGSPPRSRQDVKKIPSLFEIEVHPPGQSPKPSLPAVSRPSGFYSETTVSPKPGAGLKSTGPVSSPNIGMVTSSATGNQQAPSNQGNMGGPGLLQTPVRPGNMMGAPMGNNRPAMMMGIQQGMNTQQQRPSGGPPIQFLGPGQMNGNQQGGSLPPVLNMLGAIIREAAMQKGPGGTSNIGPTNMLQNMQNMGPGINIVGANNMQQRNLSMLPNSMAQNGVSNMMLPNNGVNMQPNNTSNMGPLQNIIGPNSSTGNMGFNNIMGMTGPNNSLGPNNGVTSMGSNNSGSSDSLESTTAVNSTMGSNANIGKGQEVGIMDVDYRIKPEFGEIEEANKDLSELDKIRQQLQAQIDKEDEDEQAEIDGTENDSDDDSKLQIKEELGPGKEEGLQEKEDLKDDTAIVKTEVAPEVEHMEIPANLPKKQRELFMRIQQQQLLREKERKRQEALKTSEDPGAKADDDDWYSSDEDDNDGKKPKLADVLKKLNQKPSTVSSGTSPSTSAASSSTSTTSSTASTFNIIQMINAIKSQTTSKPLPESGGTPPLDPSSTLSSSMNSQQKETILSSPTSPPSPVSTSHKNVSSISNLHLPALTVDPPAVNAQPVKPLVYSVVKISLDVPKPYTQLPDNVNASDPAYKDDPRVKWHLHYLEKQIQKAPQRKDSIDGERLQKKTDPRLKRGPSDPRLAKSGDSPNSSKGDSRPSDPRLQRAQAQSRPADPRLARQVAGNVDPRLSRQHIQNNPDGIFVSGPVNGMGGGPVNGMGGGPVNSMGGGPVNNMGGGPGNNMGGGPGNNMGGGPGNNMGGGPGNNMGGGPISSMRGVINNHLVGPMNNIVGVLMNQGGGPVNQMSGSVTSMGGGPVNSNLVGSLAHNAGPMSAIVSPMNNQLGNLGRPFQGNVGPVGNNISMMGEPMNNMAGPVNQIVGPFNQMGPGTNHMNRMVVPQGPGNHVVGLGNGNMIGVHMGNIMRGPINQQIPVGSDVTRLGPRMNNSSGPRPAGQRAPNDPRAGIDPRLAPRLLDPREQRLYTKDPSSGVRDPHSMNISSPNDDGLNGGTRAFDTNNDFRPLPSNLREQDDFRKSPSFFQSNAPFFNNPAQFKMARVREESTPNSDHRLESNECLQPTPSSSSLSALSPPTQHSDTDEKPVRKFDHRNDPRFKRVKRLACHPKSRMEYSSPLSSEDGREDIDDRGDPSYNSYNQPKIQTRDPRNRGVHSPSLPDSLQDFDLPNSSAVTVQEAKVDLKVKDLFKTIDPTASPFC